MENDRPKDKPEIFNAREVGRSLREVAFDLIRAEDQNVESRWFHSQKDADLFYWKDQRNNIIKQQVSFYGQVLEWNVLEGVRTGFIIEDDSLRSSLPAQSATPLVQFDSSAQSTTVEQGVEIIGNIPGLNDGDKLQIIENFLKSPSFASLRPEDILRRYGLPGQSNRPKWLVRMLEALYFWRRKK